MAGSARLVARRIEKTASGLSPKPSIVRFINSLQYIMMRRLIPIRYKSDSYLHTWGRHGAEATTLFRRTCGDPALWTGGSAAQYLAAASVAADRLARSGTGCRAARSHAPQRTA